jgi:hypothetical protein
MSAMTSGSHRIRLSSVFADLGRLRSRFVYARRWQMGGCTVIPTLGTRIFALSVVARTGRYAKERSCSLAAERYLCLPIHKHPCERFLQTAPREFWLRALPRLTVRPVRDAKCNRYDLKHNSWPSVPELFHVIESKNDETNGRSCNGEASIVLLFILLTTRTTAGKKLSSVKEYRFAWRFRDGKYEESTLPISPVWLIFTWVARTGTAANRSRTLVH